MGGVRNRDEKRKAAKVFSSAGGSGTKGAAVLDKRGQELQCPHCDRIFKQSGRLNDHVKKQHSGTLESESEDTNNKIATRAAAGGGAPSAVVVPGATSAGSASQSTSKPAPRVMDIGSRGGAYDLKSPKLLLQEMLFRNKAPKARYKTLSSAATATATGAHHWRCRVVLPHPKQSEKDVVLFLDEKYAAHSEDEAQQCGAVVALHHLAGDRALERSLPPAYIPLWKALGQAAQERVSRETALAQRRAEQQAKQQAALKRRGPATIVMTEENRRMVEGIIAALHQRDEEVKEVGEAVEKRQKAFREAHVHTDHGGDADDEGLEILGCRPGAASPLATSRVDPTFALVDDLVVLGFSQDDAARAADALRGGQGGAGDDDVLLSSALDWLCLNVPEDQLPSNFAPGAAGKPLTVLHRPGKITPPSAGAATHLYTNAVPAARDVFEDDGSYSTNDPAVAELAQYGYPPSLCAEALQASGGHVHDALRLLWSRVLLAAAVNSTRAEANQPPPSDDDDNDDDFLREWLGEREALEAIYASDVTFHSESWTSLALTVVLESAAAEEAARHLHLSGKKVSKDSLMIDGLRVVLEVWAPKHTTPRAAWYPDAVPALAVSCQGLPPRTLLAMTHSLAKAAEEMRGSSMVYELATHVIEVLPECILNPAPSLEVLLGGNSKKHSGVAAKERAPSSALIQNDLGYVHVGNGSTRKDGVDGRNQENHTRRQERNQKSRKKGVHSSDFHVGAESARLLQSHQELEASANHASMRTTRSKLPAFSKRSEILSKVSGSRVVVISGATGCGKSTQVPQYILEEAITGGTGAACNIICTQPRRISAVGLASRVASERGEPVGESVGYSVRLDSKQTSRTRLLFCTTGILLRRFLSDDALTGTTHVILDEVHERSIESDLLLMLLRDLLASGVNPNLRVVLMSATADAQLFAKYFESSLGAPSAVLTIPGFTHPVTDYFLEDALEATGMVIGKSSKWASKKSKSNSASLSGKESCKDDLDGTHVLKTGLDGSASDAIHTSYSSQTIDSLRNVDESLLNYDLVEALVVHIAQTSQPQSSNNFHQGYQKTLQNKENVAASNAILIFAPGAEEIGRIVRTLQSSSRLTAATAANGGSVRILPLHGGLPPSHQSRVFERPPPRVLKIVVATNVAETSITIDDVVCVIDVGRVKEMRFDSERGIARLQETWVSQASAQQRRGRAGRVRPGTCFRLFSRHTWGKMALNTPPEIARAPLQSLVMDIKGILRHDDERASKDAEEILARMIDPPKSAAVATAVTALKRVGALDSSTGSLTPLGKHLTRMPCDPRVGKMLLFGAMLRCLDPVLTVAALQGHGRPAFFSPPDRREEAQAAHAKLTASVRASKSDHIAAVAAYNGWRAALAKGGRGSASEFCSRYFISDQAMEGIHAGRHQYAEILADLGFIPSDYPSAASAPSYSPGSVHSALSPPLSRTPVPASLGDGPTGEAARFCGPAGVDQFSGHARVVKAAFAAGLYPQLLRVDHPASKYQKVLGGAVEAEGEAGKVRLFDRERGRVFLHPSSVNFSCGKFESGWLVYSDIVQTSKVFCRETSMVPVYAVLLFGGDVSVHHEAGLVRVDDWATFKAPARIAVLVRELRREVAALLERKVEDPELDVGASRVVEAMHHLLSTDGF